VKFLVDLPLAGLAKWLRFCGFDAAVRRLARPLPPLASGVFLLTRQQALASPPREDLLVLAGPDPESQLAEVIRLLKISRKDLNFLSRCGRCNEILVAVPREQVLGLVPEHVFHTQVQFHQCPQCRQIFWAGTHLTGILARTLAKLN
jgi:uncharacterized protein with PIN domain